MYHIIVNPASQSGKGINIWKRLEQILVDHKAEYHVYFTQKDNPCGDIVKSVCEEAESRKEEIHIVLLGGDGTVNEVLQVIPSFENLKITVIPTGSSNDLARDLIISDDPEEVLTHMLENPTSMRVDLGNVHCENSLVRQGNMAIPDRRFIVSTGIGYDAAICEEVERSKLKPFLNRIGLGKLVYLGVALRQLAATKYITAEITLDGDEKTIIHLDRVLFVAGMNHRFEGGGFMFGPHANNHDGIIDLCSVSKISKSKILRVLPTAYKGEHFRFDGIDPFRARKYTVRTSEPLWVHTDGEVRTKADFVSVWVDKELIHLVY